MGALGSNPREYSQWKSHSNRLIPIYSYGVSLDEFKGRKSIYRDQTRLEALYGRLPASTLNPRAEYMDQTDVYQLQQRAVQAGKKYIIVLVFDGMDWQTTRAASIHKSQRVYSSGRGSGLYFQDYAGATTDFGFFVTSAHNSGTKTNVTAQAVRNPGGTNGGGFAFSMGGSVPWTNSVDDEYLMGKSRSVPHAVTDSAASATSLFAGIKTYNGAINFDPHGKQVETIARTLQRTRKFAIGIVSSVPVSHATPAAAYANNVHRGDYQDITRDLVGLRSASHRRKSLPGVDVLLGAGWGVVSKKDDGQGRNFVPGNRFMTLRDLRTVNHVNGGKYVVALRTHNKSGNDVLMKAARKAYKTDARLLGIFGTKGGNLPFQTADGKFDPVGSKYTRNEVAENPTLAKMTQAALGVLSASKHGFWLMIEAGDVDWANHSTNIDNSIGAVLSGDSAFRMVTKWIESRNAWNETAVIVTADHGHYFVLSDPNVLVTHKQVNHN